MNESLLFDVINQQPDTIVVSDCSVGNFPKGYSRQLKIVLEYTFLLSDLPGDQVGLTIILAHARSKETGWFQRPILNSLLITCARGQSELARGFFMGLSFLGTFIQCDKDEDLGVFTAKVSAGRDCPQPLRKLCKLINQYVLYKKVDEDDPESLTVYKTKYLEYVDRTGRSESTDEQPDLGGLDE